MSITGRETGLLLPDGCIKDENVLIGYTTDRKPQEADTRIGAKARIRSGTVIYAGTTIGNNLETGHNVVIREDNLIGDELRIWNSSTIDYGCRIGNRVRIHCNVYVAQFTVIEDDAFLAPGVTIANDIHPGCPASRECMRGPTIKRGAQIGAGAVILPYVTIGEYALVAAGSVVTADVPPRSLARGTPARVVGPISELKCKTGLVDKPYGDCYEDTIP